MRSHPSCLRRGLRLSSACLSSTCDRPRHRAASLNPFPRLKEFQRLRFARSGFGLVIVYPSNERRQTHQNRFRSTTRFKPEYRATIVKKIELDIPSAAIKLVLTFLLTKRFIHTSARDGNISLEKCVPHFLDKRK